MAKTDAVTIKNGKLGKSDGSQIAYGESSIASDHWTKCSIKCKSESNLIKSLGVSDERTTAIKKEK